MQAVSISSGIRSPDFPANTAVSPSLHLGTQGQRLNSKQLRALSKEWRGRAAVGEANAHRVADALMWVAKQRAKEEPAVVKVLANRALQLLGGR